MDVRSRFGASGQDLVRQRDELDVGVLLQDQLAEARSSWVGRSGSLAAEHTAMEVTPKVPRPGRRLAHSPPRRARAITLSPSARHTLRGISSRTRRRAMGSRGRTGWGPRCPQQESTAAHLDLVAEPLCHQTGRWGPPTSQSSCCPPAVVPCNDGLAAAQAVPVNIGEKELLPASARRAMPASTPNRTRSCPGVVGVFLQKKDRAVRTEEHAVGEGAPDVQADPGNGTPRRSCRRPPLSSVPPGELLRGLVVGREVHGLERPGDHDPVVTPGALRPRRIRPTHVVEHGFDVPLEDRPSRRPHRSR